MYVKGDNNIFTVPNEKLDISVIFTPTTLRSKTIGTSEVRKKVIIKKKFIFLYY